MHRGYVASRIFVTLTWTMVASHLDYPNFRVIYISEMQCESLKPECEHIAGSFTFTITFTVPTYPVDMHYHLPYSMNGTEKKNHSQHLVLCSKQTDYRYILA